MINLLSAVLVMTRSQLYTERVTVISAAKIASVAITVT